MAKNKDIKDKAAEKADAGPLARHERWCGLLIAGNYRTARAEAAKALTSPSASDPDKAAAGELLQRTGLDPGAFSTAILGLAVVLVIGSLLFF